MSSRPSPPQSSRRRSRSPSPRSSSRRDGGGDRNDYKSSRSRQSPSYERRDDRDRERGSHSSRGNGSGRDRGGDRERERDRDRDRERDSYRRSRGGDRDRDSYRGERDNRRRSPPPPTSSKSSAAPPAQITGGDGGWGRQQQQVIPGGSPGRPSKSLPSQSALVPGGGGEVGERKEVKVIEPNFAPSGALAAETNTLHGVVLKYNEPPEARKPVRNWRLYVFKGKEQLDLFHVQRQSCYLIGRDRVVADIPVEHPSTSKQHAVLQYRQVIEKNEFGDQKTLTKPFMIDLDSANGTLVNDEMIPASRYYELKSGDVIKFAFSTREYVLLAE